jgi:WD40 repeat protein
MKRAATGAWLFVMGCGGAAVPPHGADPPSTSSSPPPFARASACPARSEGSTHAAVARQLLDTRHTREIVRLAFSPDGRLLASASNDGSVRVWDASHHVALRVVNRVAPYTPLAWGDEQSLAFQGLGYLAVQYDVATGVLSTPPSPGPARDLVRAAASSGGKWLQVETMSRRVNLVDVGGKKLDHFELSAGEKLGDVQNDLTFSGDAGTVAAAYAHDALVVRATSANAAERVVRIAGAEQVDRIGLAPDGAAAVVSTRIGAWSYVSVVATQPDSAPSRLPWPSSEGLRLASGSSNGGGPHVSDLAVSSQRAAAATPSGLFVWALEGKKLAWSRAVPPELGVPVVQGKDFANRVAFSPDGSLLACGTDSGRLLVYDAASGRFQGELGAKTRHPFDLAFLSSKRLAVASTDPFTHASNVSEWSLDDARLDRSVGSEKLEAIAARDDGSLVSLRAPDDAACPGRFVREVDGQPGAKHAMCVAGSNDADPWLAKTQLAPRAGVALVPLGINPLGVLDLRTGGTVPLAGTETPQDLPFSAVVSPNGAWVVAYTQSGGVVWDARTGKVAARVPLPPPMQTPPMAISRDGTTFAAAVTTLNGTVVATFETATGKAISQTPLSGGVVTALAFGETKSVLAVGGAGAIRGSVLVLRDGIIAAASKDDADIPVRIAVDPSGAIAATVGQDGATRIWDMHTVALRATLAEFADGESIAVTPGGAYAGTEEVANRIGWVFDSPAERFGFEQFSTQFHDVAIVKRRLAGEPVDVAVHAERPPSVSLASSSATRGPVRDAVATIEVHASSSDRVDVVRVFADGRPIGEKAICAPSGDAELQVPLLKGVNRVTAVAFDSRGFASNELTTEIVATRDDLPKPDLWVVAVGVGKYRALGVDAQLEGPSSDASGIAALFRAMDGGAYGKVHVTKLVDDEATPDTIRHAIEWLGGMKATDVGVLFLAGHGLKPTDAADTLFLTGGTTLTSDGRHVAPDSLARDALGWRDISDGIARAKGRVLVMLDACHAGHFSQDIVVENDDLAASLLREHRAGAIVFAASKGRQVSLEPNSARGLTLDASHAMSVRASDGRSSHGFFTGAFLSAMSDPATDRDGDGAIELSEMIDEVSRRVATFTWGAQTPWVARRDLFGDFKLGDTPPPLW